MKTVIRYINSGQLLSMDLPRVRMLGINMSNISDASAQLTNFIKKYCNEKDIPYRWHPRDEKSLGYYEFPLERMRELFDF